MEHLVVNISGKVQRKRFNDRDFLVAPLTLIVPGVLNGSNGPILYELQDMEASANAWNGMPLLLNHPKEGSGRTPEVIERYGLGTVFRAGIRDGKLVAEGWFDEQRVKNIHPRLYGSLLRGDKIELSTGLNMAFENKRGFFKNRQFNSVARNYKPDHLAILPDDKGACSVHDGCGVNNRLVVNIFTDLKENDMAEQYTLNGEQRKEIIDDLISNCKCWDEADRETLENADNKTLFLYSQALDVGRKLNEATEKIETLESQVSNQESLVEAAKKGFKAGNQHWSLNDKGEWVKNEDVNKEDDTDDDMEGKEHKKGKKMAKNSEGGQASTTNHQTEPPKPKTAQEWLAEAPEEIRNTFMHAQEIEQREKDSLIDGIKNSSRNPHTEDELKAMGLSELRKWGKALIDDKVDNATPNYVGARIPPRTDNVEKPEPLGLPVWNWDKAAKA